MNRIASINQREIDNGFKEAQKRGFALVGFASHDFRDLEPEVDYLYEMIKKSSKKFKNVKFKFSEAKNAFVETVKRKENIKVKPLKFDIKYFKETKKDFARIQVKVRQGEVFGPQPFLAFKTKKNRFFNDNFDFSNSKGTWNYAFHSDTIPLKDLSVVGVAANDKLGNVHIQRIRVINKNKVKKIK